MPFVLLDTTNHSPHVKIMTMHDTIYFTKYAHLYRHCLHAVLTPVTRQCYDKRQRADTCMLTQRNSKLYLEYNY